MVKNKIKVVPYNIYEEYCNAKKKTDNIDDVDKSFYQYINNSDNIIDVNDLEKEYICNFITGAYNKPISTVYGEIIDINYRNDLFVIKIHPSADYGFVSFDNMLAIVDTEE